MTTFESVLLIVGGIAILGASGNFTEYAMRWNRRLIDFKLFGGEDGARFFTRAIAVIIGLAWIGGGVAALVR